GELRLHVAPGGELPRVPKGRRVSRPRPAGGDPATGRPGPAAPAGPAPCTEGGAAPGPGGAAPHVPAAQDPAAAPAPAPPYAAGAPVPPGSPATPKTTPLRGTDLPPAADGRRRGGLGAWARRLAGKRPDPHTAPTDDHGDTPDTRAPEPVAAAPARPETWPDPATLLLTALGPGPRLWERGPDHPEALAVRLGTADRAAPDGSGLLPAVPV